MSIRILLADDHQIIRDGLRVLIEKQPGMQVVAVAQNGQAAVDLACELKPDISAWISTCRMSAASMPPARF